MKSSVCPFVDAAVKEKRPALFQLLVDMRLAKLSVFDPSGMGHAIGNIAEDIAISRSTSKGQILSEYANELKRLIDDKKPISSFSLFDQLPNSVRRVRASSEAMKPSLANNAIRRLVA